MVGAVRAALSRRLYLPVRDGESTILCHLVYP